METIDIRPLTAADPPEAARLPGALDPDSYTANHPSHRLYHRLGFEIRGDHFIKPIGGWSGRDSA